MSITPLDTNVRTCNNEGMRMVKEGYQQVTVIFRSDLWKALKLASLEDDTNASAIIETLVEEYIAKRAKKLKGK